VYEKRGGRVGSKQTDCAYHVLVVDDNPDLATVVAASLEHVDNELRTSHTTEPRDALTRLRRGRVDCLVTDYEMPEIDGLTLVDEDKTDTPFVVFTQRRDDRVESAAQERGGAYLTKQANSEQYRQLATLVREQVRN